MDPQEPLDPLNPQEPPDPLDPQEPQDMQEPQDNLYKPAPYSEISILLYCYIRKIPNVPNVLLHSVQLRRPRPIRIE